MSKKVFRNMIVAVYSKPDCVQCSATYRALDSKGINYQVIDVSEDPEALSFVTALGHKQVPVVIADEKQWSGFRPDLIEDLNQELMSK